MTVPEIEVIAEREFHLADGRPFIVRWMKPIPVFMPHEDWLCFYDFVHPDGFKYRNSAYGVDSAQALVNALQGAAVNLYRQEAVVYWLQPNDDLGLPLPVSRENLLNGRTIDRNAERNVDR